MSNTILLKRSDTPGAVPTTGNLTLGELAINVVDGNLFTKIDSGTPTVINLTDNQTITLSGDVTGNGKTSISTTLANTAVTPGTYGNATAIPTFTVDSKGRITSASFSMVDIYPETISNGTSNVNIAVADGNITMAVNGNSNIVVVTDTGANINGYLNVTGNANVGNAGGTNAVFTNLYGTLQTAAQPNITSVGTLTSLDVTNTATVGNVSTGGTVSATGNITGGNLISNALISGTTVTASGNVNGGNVISTNLVYGTTLTASGNITGGNLISNALVSGTTVTASGNVNGGNVNVTNAVNGTTADFSGNVSTGNVSGTTGSFTYVDGTLTTAAQPNVTSVGTLTSLSVTNTATVGNLSTAGTVSATGNITGGNLISNALVSGTTVTASGNVNGGNVISTNLVSGTTLTASGNVNGGNLISTNLVSGTTVTASGNVNGGNVNVTNAVNGTTADFSGNVSTGNVSGTTGSFTNLAGTLTTAAQPNVTSVGTLTTLSINGDTNQTGNINLTGNVNVIGNLNYEYVNDLVIGDPLIYLGANNVGNLVDLGFVVSYDDGLYQHGGFVRDHLTGVWGLFGNVVEEPTTIIDWANAIYQPIQTGALTATSGIFTGNVSVGNLTSTLIGGTLTTTAQPNITSVGTLSSLSVTSTATVGNLSTAGTVSATGNITGGNLISNALVSGTTVTASGNVNGGNVNVTNAVNGTTADFSGNVSTGNVSGTTGSFTNLAGTLTTAAQPNVTSVGTLTSLSVTNTATVGNLSTAGTVSATGNITGGNLISNALVSGTTVTATGNVNGNNATITNGVYSTTVTATGNIDGGNLTTVGNLSASYLFGNGAYLSGIDTSRIANGTSNVAIAVVNGNVAVGVGGIANIAVFSISGLTVTGNIYGTDIYKNGITVLNANDVVDGGTY